MGNVDFPLLLSRESRERLEEARRLGLEVLEPVANAGVPGRVNRPLIAALGKHGLLPQIFPPALGGSGSEVVSAVNVCLLREGLARGCTEGETALALQGLGAYPILQAGGDELRSQWIPRVARGEAVAAFALTEPGAGTDAAALECRATRVDGGYRVTGAKKWISNAPEADVYSVFARTSGDGGARGITAFAIPGDAKGLRGESLDLVAAHPIGSLELDDVFVPDSAMLGEVDRGFSVAMQTLDLFRPSVGAAAVGMAQAALDAAIDHASDRRAFGKALRDLQAVSHRVAEAAVRTKAARLLVYEAAAAADAREPVTKAAAMAKLYATETAQFVIDVAIQVHGAQGLERGHLLERLYREVRATRIYEGTSEIQREIIARELFRE